MMMIPKIMRRYNKDKVQKWDGGWNRQRNLLAIRLIKQCTVVKLSLYDNDREHVVKDILHIRFTRLQHLVMNGNQLYSIELLNRVEMPNLRHLNISYNNIKTVKTFRKAKWPLLQTLAFGQNFILDSEYVTKGFFCKLKELVIDDDPVLIQWDVRYKISFIDLRNLAKLQSKTLGFLRTHVARVNLQPYFPSIFSQKRAQDVVHTFQTRS